jgi:hypothetical protein
MGRSGVKQVSTEFAAAEGLPLRNGTGRASRSRFGGWRLRLDVLQVFVFSGEGKQASACIPYSVV